MTLNLSEAQSSEAKFDDQLLISDCRAAAAALERARNAPSRELAQHADTAERLVVRARDNLIHRLRQDGSSPISSRWHDILDQLNVALSLIIAVEYPLGAIQRQPAEQARDILNRLADRVLAPQSE
jgi:hypothetical protein